MTPTTPARPPEATPELRYHIVLMNLAADNIVPSIVHDYPAWGFLHDPVNAMTTPCTSQDVPLREPAYYTNLAVQLIEHHNEVQRRIRTSIGISPRATYVRDQLIKGSYAAAQIGHILSKLQLNEYHNIINHRHKQPELQSTLS